MPKTVIEEQEEEAKKLAKEFCEIRDHERVAEIFEGLYIYDRSLPCLLYTSPSPRDRG